MDKKGVKYLLRTIHNDTYYYVYNKRILLHHADMARKFPTIKAALRFYKQSDFNKKGIVVNIVPYGTDLHSRAAI